MSEINTYDPAGNRARVQTTYQQFTFANGSRAFYDDEQLANAVNNIPEFASKFPLSAKNTVFDLAYQGNPKDPDDGGYSTYFTTSNGYSARFLDECFFWPKPGVFMSRVAFHDDR
ncbi:MAG TPA: hypothetical protein VGK82_13020 [Pyrinomonadaceae bacterium]